MKKFFLMSIVVGLSFASVSSMANADGEAMYAALGCIGCHGDQGRSTDENFPSLAGKSAEWIAQQLEYFQSGERENSYMNAMAPMAEGFELSIAEYLSIQDPKK